MRPGCDSPWRLTARRVTRSPTRARRTSRWESSGARAARSRPAGAWPRPGMSMGSGLSARKSFTAADQEKWREHPGSIKALGDIGVLRGHQPVCVSPLRAAALGPGPASRDDDGALGPALRAHGDVVGAVRRVASLPGALPVPVAAGIVRRGHLLPAAGTAAAVVRGPPAPGLRLRRMRSERGAQSHVGEGRAGSRCPTG